MADETQDQAQDQQAAADAVADEMARLREVAKRFAPFEQMADSLDADPSKIYAIRAALEGQPQNQQPNHQQQQENRPLTAEQIAILNARALENPVGTMAEIAQLAARQQMAQFESAASPYMTTTADLFIETFKTRKAGEDGLYKQIAPLFEREMNDVNRSALLQQTPAERQRTLELRWNSASAQVFRKAASAQASSSPSNLGGSGAGAPAGQQKKSVLTRNAAVAALTQSYIDQGLLSEDDVKAIESSIEDEDN